MAIGGHQYILIAVNQLTKWAKASPAAFATAKNVASFLLKFLFSWNDSPRVLLSNNGLYFISQVVNKIFKLFETYPTFAAPCYMVTNGNLERGNGTLVSILRKMTALGPLH